MPKFYFSATEDGDDIQPDEEALEYASLKHACQAAEVALREMAWYATVPRIWMSVIDARRRLVYRVQHDVAQGRIKSR